jgi:hypothetical protein
MKLPEFNDLISWIVIGFSIISLYYLRRRYQKYQKHQRFIQANEFANDLTPGEELGDDDVPEYFDCNVEKTLYRGKEVIECYYEYHGNDYPRFRTKNGIIQTVSY